VVAANGSLAAEDFDKRGMFLSSVAGIDRALEETGGECSRTSAARYTGNYSIAVQARQQSR